MGQLSALLGHWNLAGRGHCQQQNRPLGAQLLEKSISIFFTLKETQTHNLLQKVRARKREFGTHLGQAPCLEEEQALLFEHLCALLAEIEEHLASWRRLRCHIKGVKKAVRIPSFPFCPLPCSAWPQAASGRPQAASGEFCDLCVTLA